MKQSSRNIAAAVAPLAYLLTAGLSHAETLPGQLSSGQAELGTAGKQHLTCSYGPWTQAVLRSGATVLSRTWTCQ